MRLEQNMQSDYSDFGRAKSTYNFGGITPKKSYRHTAVGSGYLTLYEVFDDLVAVLGISETDILYYISNSLTIQDFVISIDGNNTVTFGNTKLSVEYCNCLFDNVAADGLTCIHYSTQLCDIYIVETYLVDFAIYNYTVIFEMVSNSVANKSEICNKLFNLGFDISSINPLGTQIRSHTCKRLIKKNIREEKKCFHNFKVQVNNKTVNENIRSLIKDNEVFELAYDYVSSQQTCFLYLKFFLILDGMDIAFILDINNVSYMYGKDDNYHLIFDGNTEILAYIAQSVIEHNYISFKDIFVDIELESDINSFFFEHVKSLLLSLDKKISVETINRKFLASQID